MRHVGVQRLAACTFALVAISGCASSLNALHVAGGVGTDTSLPGSALDCSIPGSQAPSTTATITSPPVPSPTATANQSGSARSKAASTTTTDAISAVPTTIGTGTSAVAPTSTTCAPRVTDAIPPTAMSTTTAPTSTTVPMVRPDCSSGPSLTLTPSYGPIGTHVVEVARCFPPHITVTFEVPQSGGVGFVRAPTDTSGSATMQFTYSSPNGSVGSTTYPLLVSIDPNGGVDHSCTATSCASATFYER